MKKRIESETAVRHFEFDDDAARKKHNSKFKVESFDSGTCSKLKFRFKLEALSLSLPGLTQAVHGDDGDKDSETHTHRHGDTVTTCARVVECTVKQSSTNDDDRMMNSGSPNLVFPR